MWILISVTEKPTTNTLLKNEAVKEEVTETNTKTIERIISGSNKICIREDLAKEKMMFSQESRQAIFEMGNVELIELKISKIQCLSCLRFTKEQLFTHVACISDPTSIWYDVSKQLLKFSQHPTSVRLWLLQGITNTTLTYGRNTTTKQKTHCEERKRPKGHSRRSGIDGKMTRPTGSLNLPLVGRMLGWDTWTILHQLISLIKRRKNKEVDTTICFYLPIVEEDRQAPPLSTRPGYQEAKTALVEMKRQSRQVLGIPFIPKSDRRRLNDQLNPSLRGYHEWLSIIWAEYFTETQTANLIFLFSVAFNTLVEHTLGLRIGKGGINTAGRMTSGQINGDRQHRNVFKMKSILASWNWGHGFKQTSQTLLSTRTKRPDRHPDFLFNLVAFRVQSDATHWTRRGTYTEPPTRTFSGANTTAPHSHISSVGTAHWLKVKWVARHSQCFTSISFRDVVVKCSLSSVPTCFVPAFCTVIKTLSV